MEPISKRLKIIEEVNLYLITFTLSGCATVVSVIAAAPQHMKHMRAFYPHGHLGLGCSELLFVV